MMSFCTISSFVSHPLILQQSHSITRFCFRIGVQIISKTRPQLPPWMLQCIPSESFSISWSSGFAAGSVHADALYSGRCSKRCITAFVSVWYEQLFRTYTSVANRMRNAKFHGYHRRWTLACAQNLDRTTYATDYTFLTRAIACRSISIA
jgi:hypothetical protein